MPKYLTIEPAMTGWSGMGVGGGVYDIIAFWIPLVLNAQSIAKDGHYCMVCKHPGHKKDGPVLGDASVSRIELCKGYGVPVKHAATFLEFTPRQR